MILLHALSAIFYLAAMAGFAAGVLTLSTGGCLILGLGSLGGGGVCFWIGGEIKKL